MQKLIRASELAKKLSISKVTLWRMEKRGELPPKIQISERISGWRESDITEWISNRELSEEHSMEEFYV